MAVGIWFKVIGLASKVIIRVLSGSNILCFKRNLNEANGSIKSRIDSFASFARQTADNCKNINKADRSFKN